VLIADDLPIDQHYVHNPDELFNRPMEDLIIDLNSKVVLEAHLQCAGQEMPLSVEDAEYFGPLMKEICETRLTKDKDGWYESTICSSGLATSPADQKGITQTPSFFPSLPSTSACEALKRKSIQS
jgi:ATP-dependent helicase YprA (DUF1998 family)